MKKIALLLAFTGCLGVLHAQELNCKVQVISPQIQGTNEKVIFEALQKDIFEFINNRKWTNDVFGIDERIECTFFLTINEKLSSDEYKATLQVQASRPAFKSSYNTLMLNHNDQEIQFKYVQFQPMDFSMQQHQSNLTSILAYYVYLVLATDYDTFSLNGGTQWYQRCQTIVANAQSAPEKGWRSFDGTKNRYWLVDNMLNPQFAPMRECYYKYHRLGFDVMHQDVNTGRAAVLEALLLLKKVHQFRPLSFNMQYFFNAKFNEVVDLFKGAQPDEKAKVVELLNQIDPGHGVQYQKIQSGQ